MSQSHNFRSALGGFNREDVVRYIEYINSKNTSAVNQLKSENQSLKDELNALRANQSAPVEPAEDLRPELDAALAKIAELEASKEKVEEPVIEAEAEIVEEAPAAKTCPVCGNAADSKFCPQCGAPMGE